MKTRSGFVSNSSSSSFVILTTREAFEGVLGKSSDAMRALVQSLKENNSDVVKDRTLFGRDMVSIGYLSGNESTFEYGIEARVLNEVASAAGFDEECELREELDKFIDDLQKQIPADQLFFNSADF